MSSKYVLKNWESAMKYRRFQVPNSYKNTQNSHLIADSDCHPWFQHIYYFKFTIVIYIPFVIIEKSLPYIAFQSLQVTKWTRKNQLLCFWILAYNMAIIIGVYFLLFWTNFFCIDWGEIEKWSFVGEERKLNLVWT